MAASTYARTLVATFGAAYKGLAGAAARVGYAVYEATGAGPLPAQQAEVLTYTPMTAPTADLGRSGAVVAADNGIVQFYVAAGGLVGGRRFHSYEVGVGSTWSSPYSFLFSTAFPAAGIVVALLTDGIRLYWQDSVSNKIRHSDSIDNGASYSAASDLWTVGAPIRGLAGDSGVSTAAAVLFYAYDVAGPAQRVAALVGGVATDWTLGDLSTINGIAAVRNGDGSFSMVVAITGGTGAGYGLFRTTYSAVGSWSTLTKIAVLDVPGASLETPHLALFDGLYGLTYTVNDTGSVSGLAGQRVARVQSADMITWTAAIQDTHTLAYGAVWLKDTAAGYFLLSADTALRAPFFDPTQSVIIARTTAGVVEDAAAPGTYEVTIPAFGAAWSGHIDWDIAGFTGVGAVEAFTPLSPSVPYPRQFVASFGATYRGQASPVARVGYTLYDSNGVVLQARTTAGVVESSVEPGTYLAVALGFNPAWTGRVDWDIAGFPGVGAVESFGPWDYQQIGADVGSLLDPRKRALMVSTRARMRADRPTALVAISTTGGVTTYTLLNNCVFRQHMESDQTTALTLGTSQVDALAELPLTDPVTMAVINPTQIAYVALTGTASSVGVAAANKYEILSYKQGGIIPNRWVLQLRRMR